MYAYIFVLDVFSKQNQCAKVAELINMT